MNEGNAPPASIPAEQALLGAVLMQPQAYYLVTDILDADCFAEPIHAKFWEMIQLRLDGGRTLDPVQLAISLGPDAEEKIPNTDLTAREYIARLAANATSIISAPDYAKTIRSLWKRRRLMALGQQIAYRAQGSDQESDVDELMEELDSEFSAIKFGEKTPGIMTMRSAVVEAIDMTARVYQGGAEPGIESRVPELAELLGPLMRGDLVTLLAASGNGKTALAAQIMTDAATPLDNRDPASSLMFSQEMLAVQIARRAIAAESGVPTWRQRKAAIDFADFDALTTAARKLELMPIYIDQTANQKISAIMRKARHMKKMYGISLVIVDHLLEVRAEHSKQSKFDVIENAARELKKLAKEESLIVLLLAQVTREAQKRDHWRVRDQDLFGGDVVKQSSDVMFSVSIPSVFIQQREPRPGSEDWFKWQSEMEEWHGKAEIGILKMRDGENGGRKIISWNGPRQTFGSAA